MIVRVNGLLAPKLPTQNLDRTVADNLVRVHVALGTASGLEYNEWEVVDQFAGNDLICGLGDRIADFGVKPVGSINGRRGLFEHAQRLDERGRETLSRAADVKVHKGANERSAPNTPEDDRTYRWVCAPQ